MTQQLPSSPSPEDGPGKADEDQEGRRRRGRGKAPPSVDDLLAQIQHINGMVALKMMSPQAASVILNGLRTILEVQRRRAEQSQEQLATEALVAACRRDPSLINLLTRLLTDEQLERLVRETAGGAV